MGLINAWKGFWTSGDGFSNKAITKKRPLRMYAGAATSRLNSNWMAAGTSADAEIKGSIKTLRQRSRQLVRDDPHARQAVRSITSNVIGDSGIKLQAHVRKYRVNTLDTKINAQIEEAWKKWGRYDSCHTAGRLCWADIERLCCNSMIESGEVFIRMVNKPFGRSKIPFALEILEADQLDDDYTGRSSNKNASWRMGVEVDKFMRPKNYAFLTKHPGDTPFTLPQGEDRHMIIPANEIIHLYMTDRPSQTRGVPWMASAIESLHQLAGFRESAVVRARASSALMGFITSPEGELDQGGEVYDGDRVTSFSPGQFHYLQNGENVVIPDMDSPHGEFEPFMRAMLRSMAAGIGLSYESLSRDYSQSNYSSSRLALLEDRTQYKAIQNYFIENLHSRIYENWLQMAVLSGELNLPNFDTDFEKYMKIHWMPRGWSWIDPLKEVNAAKEAVRAGFKTQAQVVAEQGGDLEELLAERKDEVEQAEQLGLVFDSKLTIPTEQKEVSIDETPNPESYGGKT